MKGLKGNKERRLRVHLLQPLAITFLLLWVCTMLLFTRNTYNELETRVKTETRNARISLEEYYEFYAEDLVYRLGDEARNILIHNLSSSSLQISDLDGGIAFVVRTASGYERSQLAWGWGNQEGTDLGQRWYFTFDEGLDDQGQIELANWIIENRDSYEYMIIPEEEYGEGKNSDGRFARITGVERSGYEISVQKIEIVHPDGSVETMIETSTEGESKTWDFAYINIHSVLLPSWSSNGKDGDMNMTRRLSSFREAHALLDRELENEWHSATTANGFTLGTSDKDGVVHCTAVECNVLPPAIKQNIGLYMSTLLLTLAVLVILSAKLSKRVTLPVETLCNEVAEGKCQIDTSITELSTLAAAFNSAQQKLEMQIEREREFTRSAAHELKTPLTILRAHAECLMEDFDSEKRAAYLNIVLEESDLIASLVNSLLELSRLEKGETLNIETVDLPSLMKEVWDPMALTLEQKRVNLLSSLEGVQIEGDKEYLRKILANLASNALRHTTEGGNIKVSLHEEDGAAVIIVDNDGLPIPEDDLPRIWEPFYRVDKARNRLDGGTGLGLAIVYEAVRAHGGTCEARNRPGGVCFQIYIPESFDK